MRKLTGLLALFLGSVGVLVLAAGVFALWRLEGSIVDRTDRVTARASEGLTKAEVRLQKLETRVKNFTVDVEAVRTAAERLVARVAKDVVTRAELQPLGERLNRLLVQSEELSETLDIVARLFEDAADLSAQFDGKAARLQGVADSLERASAALAGVRAELAESRRPESVPDPQKLTDLCARSRGPLERIAGAVDSIRLRSVEARESLEGFRAGVRFWSRVVAAVLTLVFVWLGLGQLCLFGWGRKRLRSAPPLLAPEGEGGARSK